MKKYLMEWLTTFSILSILFLSGFTANVNAGVIYSVDFDSNSITANDGESFNGEFAFRFNDEWTSEFSSNNPDKENPNLSLYTNVDTSSSRYYYLYLYECDFGCSSSDDIVMKIQIYINTGSGGSDNTDTELWDGNHGYLSEGTAWYTYDGYQVNIVERNVQNWGTPDTDVGFSLTIQD